MRRNEFDLLWVLYRPVAFVLTSLGKYAKILSTTYQRLICQENENPFITFITSNIQNIAKKLQNEYINKDSIRLVLSFRCKTN